MLISRGPYPYEMEPVFKLVTDNNKYYFGTNKRNFPIHINNQPEFWKQATFVLNSPFVNHIRDQQYIKAEDGKSYIDIYAFGIRGQVWIEEINAQYKLVYEPPRWGSRDTLWMRKSKRTLVDREKIDEVLNIPFPTSCLSEYQKQVILASETIGKPICFEDIEPSNEVEMDIIEQPMQVVLCKKK